MRIVVTSIVMISILLMGMIWTAIAVGHRQPPSKAIIQLHLGECTFPCWLGITPGSTSFDEAVTRVTHAYRQWVTRNEDSEIFVDILDSNSYGQIMVQSDEGIITAILLTAAHMDNLTLGDFVNLYGQPACVLGKSRNVLVYGSSGTSASLVSTDDPDDGWNRRLATIIIHNYRSSSLC